MRSSSSSRCLRIRAPPRAAAGAAPPAQGARLATRPRRAVRDRARSPAACRAAGSSPRPPCRSGASRDAPAPPTRSRPVLRSNDPNTASIGFLNARSTSATASSGRRTADLVLQLRELLGDVGRRRSRRVESTCPNLTKIGPSVSSARPAAPARGSSNVRKDSARCTRRGSRPVGSAASANSSRRSGIRPRGFWRGAGRGARRVVLEGRRNLTGNHDASQKPCAARAILPRAASSSECSHAYCQIRRRRGFARAGRRRRLGPDDVHARCAHLANESRDTAR